MNLWLQIGGIVLGTIASEDLTCIATGLLVHRGEIGLSAGIFGCFLGIYAGDLLLWTTGRLAGRRALEWKWVARRLPRRVLERIAGWFDRNAPMAVLAIRFLPGIRMPFYIAAGALGRKPRRFLFWTFVAAMVWAPLLVSLVALLGERLVGPLEHLTGSLWIGFGLSALAAYLSLRLIGFVVARSGRSRNAEDASPPSPAP